MCSAQVKEYGLKVPDPRDQSACRDFLQSFSNMPADVTMGIYEKDGEIFWGITDDTWLARIFKDKKDGVAVDIISKSQFPCGEKNVVSGSKVYKGELLKPVLLKDVKNHILTDNQGMAGFRLGKLPDKYKGTDYELNMILIHNGKVCSYNSFFDVPRARWELLEMPLFMDSVKTLTSEKGRTVDIARTMEFVIPFEKNKFTYTENDIKPLYDSLKLKDYTIRSITIKAYSSVEGPEDNNLKLQNNRAEAIAKALEKSQNRSAIKQIKAEENWLEFLGNVDTTVFPGVHQLSRKEIKEKLEDPKLSAALEPLLSKHRKAIVTLDLVKQGSLMEANPQVLLREFQNSIEKKDSLMALQIQEVAFNRSMNNELPRDLLDTVKIPFEREFIHLYNNRTAFNIKEDLESLKSKLAEFQDLNSKFPGHASIKYNLAVLKIKVWSKGDSLDHTKLKTEISELSKYKINPALIKKMMINYHIILSEELISQRKYEAKNQALKYIFDNYKSISMKDDDLLQLAKYFSGYSRLDWAEKVLTTRIKSPDAAEDLLFYYINLTIIEPRNLKKTPYRSIIASAASRNSTRFCKMFEPYGRGGINFQLLEDGYLKKQYCESCNMKK